ncbi:hypothetical protein [Nesterenkonia pannonica]|uniref:hypothetical protein n=1 Tax=Nesterenkonia pannonica TaxID=1548602 RepID=UPI002164E791|nr:hypothetical protein [Nesterenkonia pannonica]
MIETGAVGIIAAAVLIGTVLQRMSGTGVGLVVAPVLSILLGPSFGVLVTNLTTTVSGFLIMLSVWSLVHWRRFFLMLGPIIVGPCPGPGWWVSFRPGGCPSFSAALWWPPWS